jgi:hypothetical protein
MGFQQYIAFTILVPCILSILPSQLSLCTRMKFIMLDTLITQIYFWIETLHISDSSSVHLQFHPDPARKQSAYLYDIYHCCVYSKKTPDDGQRNCPKYVEFHSKNKFE